VLEDEYRLFLQFNVGAYPGQKTGQQDQEKYMLHTSLMEQSKWIDSSMWRDDFSLIH